MDTTYLSTTEINQYNEWFAPKHRCDHCYVEFKEESMERIHGYYLCTDCYETYSNEQEDDTI